MMASSPKNSRTLSASPPASNPKSKPSPQSSARGEKDREKITTPRWQAGFDLAIGRTLAVKVRTEGYNAMLANAKQGLKFKNDKDDTWELKPIDAVTVNSALTKDADDAKKYLTRVATDNKGTPWAMDAEKELKQPLGWEWHESIHRRRRQKLPKPKPKKTAPSPTKNPKCPKNPAATRRHSRSGCA